MKQLLTILMLVATTVYGQQNTDTVNVKEEYTSIEQALQNPEKVYRLNLSNQAVNVPKDAWSKFVNLEYLSFRNDHLKEIPYEIGLLKNLKTLDLSGNNFVMLPKSISSLTSLEELFLNDETKFNLNKNIQLIRPLYNLKTLHLENDNIKRLPKTFLQLQNIESLFLNDNKLDKLPASLREMKNLKQVDVHNNKLNPAVQHYENQQFGFKVIF